MCIICSSQNRNISRMSKWKEIPVWNREIRIIYELQLILFKKYIKWHIIMLCATFDIIVAILNVHGICVCV